MISPTSALVIGPPGTGKSRFLGSVLEMDEIERGLLLAPKPSEVDSFFYAKHRGSKLDVETFRDTRWAPVIGAFKAEAFANLFRRVLSLYEDETYDVVFLDPIGDVSTLATHHALSPAKVATPGDLEGKNASIAFYGKLKADMKDFVMALVGLTSEAAARPKHVFVAAHAQPTRDEDLLGRETPEGRAKGTSFLGDVLPSIDGSYRQDVAGEFSVVGFSRLKHGTKIVDKKMISSSEYVVQINADPSYHGKVRALPFVEVTEIANDMRALFELIERARG